MLGIPNYLYRLLPANPILLRVVATAGKRKRDLVTRCVYLGLLTAIVLFALVTSSNSYSGSVSFASLTKVSVELFQNMSYVQLALVTLLAPVFTAGAITQEKDSQTYDILLATPLTNAQIVLGSLLSRLFFVVALLISGIPIFSITQIFGGVAIRSIAASFGIAIATAFVTGAMAMAIATFKVGTRRTIFSFYMAIVIFVVGGVLLDRVEATHPVLGVETTASGQPAVDRNGDPILIRAKTSWLTGINPFLALRSIFGEPAYTPPDLGKLPPNLQAWPVGWYLSRPHSFFIVVNFALSLLLVLPAVLLLRRLAQSTFSPRQWLLARFAAMRGAAGGSATGARKPRVVWNNPIAWREAKTKASAARATVIRYTFILGGMSAAVVLLALFAGQQATPTFIAPGSYNAGESTLFIQGERSGLHRVDPSSVVRLNGEPADPARVLNGRYKVADFSLRRAGGRTVLDSVDLLDMPRRLPAATVRQYLLGLIILEFAAILLIVTNAAASTVTREREDGSLDLLLSTPITSRYYIWGKLRGLVAFVLPLVAVPVASVLIFVLYDVWRAVVEFDPARQWIVFPEALLILPATLVIVSAFAAIVGMQMSLRLRTTVRAVMAGVGIVLGACAGMGFCGVQILSATARDASPVGVALASFSPFTVLALLIDPYTVAARTFTSAGDAGLARLIVSAFSLIATLAYAGIVYAMYVSMVKNFDMTIRRQSR